MVSRWMCALTACSVVSACGVRTPETNTGGATGDAGVCGRGIVVASSDYASTNVSLIDFAGGTISASLVSSASASTALSAPLSGDVVLPSMPAHGDKLVLIDRYPASVLTWVDVKTGTVSGQLSVATGFASNPQDYVEVNEHLAYVTRYEPNTHPGKEPFDAGNDILGIDPQTPVIESRLDLTPAMAGEDASLLPRAGRALRVGELVYALLEGYSTDFKRSADSRLVTIDPISGKLTSVTVLTGLHNCRGIALSPDQSELAITCSGMLTPPVLEQSGVSIVTTDQPPKEKRRFAASTFGDTPLGFSVAYASSHVIVFGTFGTLPGEVTTDDTFIRLDLTSGDHQVTFSSGRSPSCGTNQRCPFTIGDVVCVPGCGTCFVADAVTGGGVVHRLSMSAEGALLHDEPHHIEDRIGLPPRYLQIF
jgi:hypothetical protein